MKTMMKFFGLALLVTLVFTACSKDDDPADNNLFVGTYQGTTSYKASLTDDAINGDKVTVVKTGNTYRFDFNDGIPNITGITIEKGENGYVGKVNGYTGVITFDANKLNIAVAKDGATWTADCDR